MTAILALIRTHWLSFASYRLNVVFSLGGLVVLFVPVYLVSGALQPVVAESIADEGGSYFAFLVTGMAITQIVMVSMRGLPNSISSGISSGTLEALFATRTPLPHILIGVQGYEFLWGTLKLALLLAGVLVVEGSLAFTSVPLAAAILFLTVIAHLPIGLLAASMILLFRTTGPLIDLAGVAVTLLGGVYYSTSVIPDVVQPLSYLVPLTYGLRAFRRTLLSGEPLSAVSGDLIILTGLAVALLAATSALFAWSLRRAQRTGSLVQY